MRAFLSIVLLPIVVVFAVAFFSIEVASGQDTARYTKVAGQLAAVINAGDYAYIQTKFKKRMDAALPLDKTSEFFQGLTQQMGKIQKFGKPQPDGEAIVFPTECEKGALDMQIALDSRGLIAGLLFKPHVATKPAPEKHETQLSLP